MHFLFSFLRLGSIIRSLIDCNFNDPHSSLCSLPYKCSLPNKSDSLKVDNLSNFKLFNYEEIKIHRDPDCGDSQAV